MANEFLNAALSYAAAGLAVFPLRPSDKRPATRNGCKNASTDAAQIREWWTRQPDANVGIATGEKSGGLFVLDFDVDESKGENGLDTLHDWESEHGELPETVSSETGRGGMHLLYRAERVVKNSANPAAGVDVRGKGGYIVAPPSVHPSGAVYAWINDPDEMPIATADDAVFDFISSIKSAPRGVVQGSRNDTVMRYASGLRAKSVRADTLRKRAHEFNYSNCEPPLSRAEVDKIVDSVIEHYKAGLSAEAKAAKAASKKPDAQQIYNQLRDGYDVCTVDGSPAICIEGRWHLGFKYIDRAIYDVDGRAGTTIIKDVRHRILTLAPAREQADPRYIAFENGVLDMETGDFGQRPDLLIPNVIPHDWNPAAECPELDALLDRVACYDPDTRKQIEELFGGAMYRSCDAGQMPVMVNNTGANGKSTVIALIGWFVGAENATSIDVGDLGGRFQAGELAGKLVCLSDDTASAFIDESKIGVLKKAITGNRIHTDVKGGAGFDFTPYALICASANEMPRVADTSGGFERRLLGIPFNAHFSRTDADYNPRVLDAIMTPEGGSRLAFIAACGLQRLRANNGFTVSAESSELTAQILIDNDPALQFASEQGITVEWLVTRTTQEVYEVYRDWSERAGLRTLGRRSLTKRLCKKFGVVSRQQHVRTADGGEIFIYKFVRADAETA